jgi:hypothetical protein
VAALLCVNGVIQVLELHKGVVALDLHAVQGPVPADTAARAQSAVAIACMHKQQYERLLC